MTIEINQLLSFGAKLRKSCPNKPKSRRFEDFKLVEKTGIHWTLTESCEFKVVQLQSTFLTTDNVNYQK